MRSTGIYPNQFTFSAVLPACANTVVVIHGEQMHSLICKHGYGFDLFVATALVDMYAKCCYMGLAENVFDEMPDRNLVSWNCMIVGFLINEMYDQAVGFFKRVIGVMLSPDQVSFSSVLSACANIGISHTGKQVHGVAVKYGLVSLAYVKNSLMDMYFKCGSSSDAIKLFNTIGDRDVVTWNVMVMGCVQNDNFEEACNYFWVMEREGVLPDEAAFSTVLHAAASLAALDQGTLMHNQIIKYGFACAHTGRVEEGFAYFSSMTQKHNMSAGPEHYACMVDLLGRAGRLNEAKKFAETMPIKPDAMVWGALLGACRNHGDLEMGREVAEKLFEMEPYNPGNYVLLSNMYSRRGMLKEANEVRRLMGITGVRKEPGCSWIDVKNKTFVFTAHDKSHSRTVEIYEMLGKLEELVKNKGYVAETQYAINDVGEYKERSLWYHSEKLALAFGLLALPLGVPIRIKKNLRTCGDCHTVMKIASEIFEREIIVRDINRFHRFAGGLCSCRDYWYDPGS
ncbi:hypothetical protein Vadar_033182 [Vaccinium darrowii]|uniref:Uncharacterized protein n=1 Tax=Vaccinium darrowii TaxID=229202 RepID=A0ACB7X627_9ERIC|nr:hypothetical protein Vadar_033182 [Vaccinium darrowii]